MSKRIRRITSLLRKGIYFEFTSAIEVILRELLAELAAPPTLVFPGLNAVADGSRSFHVCCDACIDGFGALLEQEQPDGSVRTIAYINCTTLDSENQGTPLDLGPGSIDWASKSLRGYLWGTNFPIFVDHKALKNIGKVGNYKARVQRWLEFSHRVRLHPRVLQGQCQRKS